MADRSNRHHSPRHEHASKRGGPAKTHPSMVLAGSSEHKSNRGTGRHGEFTDDGEHGSSANDGRYNEGEDEDEDGSDSNGERRFWATASPSHSPARKHSAQVHSIRGLPRRSNHASTASQLPSGFARLDDLGESRQLVLQARSSAQSRQAVVDWGTMMAANAMNLPPGVPGVMGREHQSRLLFVSLLENYCRAYDDDPLRNRRLFFAICRTLFSMGIIGKEYVDEVAGIRATYSEAFRQLVVRAQESLGSYEQHDIESGIMSLTTGIAENDDSMGFDYSETGEWSWDGSRGTNGDGSDAHSTSGSSSSDRTSESDCDSGSCESKHISTVLSNARTPSTATANTSTPRFSASGGGPRAGSDESSMRDSGRLHRPQSRARSTSTATSTFYEAMRLRRSSRVSASSATTFESMVMDMQRSRYHDDFIQLRCLGRGGFGKVFEVRNKLDGRRYAVKQIKIKGEITADKTLREIKTLANLDHPNIVRYYSSWIEVTKLRRKPSSYQKHDSNLLDHRLAHSTSPLFALYGIQVLGQQQQQQQQQRHGYRGAGQAGGMEIAVQNAELESSENQRSLQSSSSSSPSSSLSSTSVSRIGQLRSPFGALNDALIGNSNPAMAASDGSAFPEESFDRGEEAVMLEVSVGHANGAGGWQDEADEIVFESAGNSDGRDDSDDGVVFADNDDDGIVFVADGEGGQAEDHLIFPIIDEEEEPVAPRRPTPKWLSGLGPGRRDISSTSNNESSSGSDNSYADLQLPRRRDLGAIAGIQSCPTLAKDGDSSTKEFSGDVSVGTDRSVPQVGPIPIVRSAQRSHQKHRRRGSRHSLRNQFSYVAAADEGNARRGSLAVLDSLSGQPRSLPGHSMPGLDFGQSLVAETTLFVQMQLCQTTLQEYLSQRNRRIAERHAQTASTCSSSDGRGPGPPSAEKPPRLTMSSTWIGIPDHDTLIDPILNIRLFRSIVEGVKYFHDRGVIHRDLKGANVFLDIVHSDSCGNPLSRGGSGLGRPGVDPAASRAVSLPALALVNGGMGDVHSDAWDAIDGGNLRERSEPNGLAGAGASASSGGSGSGGAGSRRIDWDEVFCSILAGQSANSAGAAATGSSTPLCSSPVPTAREGVPGGCAQAGRTGSVPRTPRTAAARMHKSDQPPMRMPQPMYGSHAYSPPLVTFIPRIGDFGLATKSTLGIRTTGDEYAFVSGKDNGGAVGSRQGSPGDGRQTRRGSVCVSGCDPSRTSNVGTITYAAPEQLEDRASDYNEKADIYSLGIIFFELYYPFATAMERIVVIKDLRRGVFPPSFVHMWPKEAAFILWLMAADPERRPSAKEILNFDLIDVPSLESAHLRREVSLLKHQLKLANQRNEELSLRVTELERLVDMSI